MKKFKKISIIAWIISCFLFFPPLISPALAYVGPGAGIAFFSSFLILMASFLLAFLIILFWPLRLLVQSFRRHFYYRKFIDKNSHRTTKKIVILGLDGLDPRLTESFMEKGLLPNFSALRQRGGYRKLKTTCPAISPVAWSTFATGLTPAGHAIFDFFTRDQRNYLPVLSSVDIQKPKGRFQKPKINSLKKGRNFWEILADCGIVSSILRVPITFPPGKFNGRLLSAMCVPDLKGTQGTFFFYSTNDRLLQEKTGGISFKVVNQKGKISSFLYGPEDPHQKGSAESQLPFEILINQEGKEAQLKVAGETVQLKPGQFSPWIRLPFPISKRGKVYGIAKFLIRSLEPDFSLYVTPLNLDPEKPALPISHPFVYAMYLSKLMGSYATLGLAEDTWALNERVLDEDGFLAQTYANHEEREKMFLHELSKMRKGVCACVFDATDRIQHMFWRYLEKDHPAHRVIGNKGYEKTIEDLYKKMDIFLGKVMEGLDKDTLLMVLSDHGFRSFRRCVNVNSWLYLQGYLSLKQGKQESGQWLTEVDWSKTRAYALGLAGIFINLKGREAQGLVQAGLEFQRLKEEIAGKLSGLRDEEKGCSSIRQVYDSQKIYQGPYTDNGPDLIIGYEDGYRISWDSAVGKVNTIIFEDNTKSWSGDHCIDPELVPGILFSNRPVKVQEPHIMDIAPSVLREFNLQIPSFIKGKSLFE